MSCSRTTDSLFDHLHFVIRKSTLGRSLKPVRILRHKQGGGGPCLEARFIQNLKFPNTTTTTTTTTTTNSTTKTSTTSATRESKDAVGIMSILGGELQGNRTSIPGRSNKSCPFSKASSSAPYPAVQ